MPPALHPRSRLTSSLFVTTLLASFVVVGVPHLLPCPAPRTVYADGEMLSDDGTKRRRRRKCLSTDGSSKDAPLPLKPDAEDGALPDLETVDVARAKRECPVPKPGGKMGELLGFTKEGKSIDGTEASGPP